MNHALGITSDPHFYLYRASVYALLDNYRQSCADFQEYLEHGGKEVSEEMKDYLCRGVKPQLDELNIPLPAFDTIGIILDME